MEDNKAVFNEAINYLNRLNKLQSDADMYSINQMNSTWFKVLCALYRELYAIMSKEEKEVCTSRLNNCRLFFININSTQKVDSIKFETALSDFDISLREVMSEHDLTMPRRKGIGSIIEEDEN